MSAARSGFPLHEGIVRRAGVALAAADALRAGDLVALEFGLWLGEHAGLAGDSVVCDGPPPVEAHRAWSAALCAAADACRADASTAAVRAAAVAAGAERRGLVAHGLGVGIEPPLVDLDGDDEAPLVAGTVLVLAPTVDGFRATRALLVRDRAPHWLEPAP
jgi:hypothetical protein